VGDSAELTSFTVGDCAELTSFTVGDCVELASFCEKAHFVDSHMAAMVAGGIGMQVGDGTATHADVRLACMRVMGLLTR
jgi:hypothetical protein